MKGEPCTIEGCERPQRARGWCGTHHERWRRHGSVADPERHVTCTVPGCDEAHLSLGLCSKHYQRVRSTGSLDGPPARDPFCTFEGCDKPHSGLGLCSTHYERQRRHGDPTVVLTTRHDDIGYGAMHDRLRRERGGAANRPCAHCGTQAAQWAYDHLDPNERVGDKGLTYSVETAHYLPLCLPCHWQFDRASTVDAHATEGETV
jgi:hypothetical protein